ncbi:lmo0937 family membrane protein [Sodalinema gerasimenkoae]|uniref:lmo0937 family membrane protein n=1 Tax=Sodalinema gerasimenkoae TaxID=2862348 RepID=UPI00135A3CA7|nr:lmo0937 family membrane protein [Sodalinema gerasimenkoae]
MVNTIWTIIAVLVILWALGFSVNLGGGLIHLLLVLALIGIIYNVITGRRL